MKKLDDLAASNMPHVVLQKQYSTTVSELQQTLTEMMKLEFLPSVKSAGMLKVSAAALQAVRPALEERTRKLQAEADRLVKQKERRKQETVPFRPLSPGEAVVDHADRILGGWAIAAIVDLLPWLLLILIVITTRDDGGPGKVVGEDENRDRPNECRPDGLNLSSHPHIVPPAPAE